MTTTETIKLLKELEEKIKYDMNSLILYFSGSTTFLIEMLHCLKNSIREDNNFQIYAACIISLIYAFKFDIKLDDYKSCVSQINKLKLKIGNDNIESY